MIVENVKDMLALLPHIDPAALDYQDWLNVGMALKDAGAPVTAWDAWSARDAARYHFGECTKKWATFNGAGHRVGAGTLITLAMDQGWRPEGSAGKNNHSLDWDGTIGGKDDLVIIDKGYLEAEDLTEPERWEPVNQLITYLETLFEAAETVGYVTEAWYNEEKKKYLPTRGNWDRTAGQLIEKLTHCKGDIGSVIGDCKPEAGAWIRFNPLDGRDVKNENVTEYRYALVESDAMPIGEQNAILRKLELPIACLVHSGGKSLHAIVRVDAADYNEYRKRVDYLYSVCQKNGLVIDKQNKNPSRLSRMPGVLRNGHKQWLVATNIGKASFVEWQEWVESVNDDLPEPESMADAWEHLPDLSPSLIDGVLRKGHKMLLAGPSKAGKSYLLIELAIALAEGRHWLGWPCAQGRVMYVNLELDRASCLHRFKDVYTALKWKPDSIGNIDIWNLRGKSAPMDKLAPKLIRRAQKKDYVAIIIDPIYKVITGDENSADQMAHFCNQFDRICTDLGSAVIYCHHHSKGYQGGKRSMDRASGSGVFARDPDALLDLTELEKTKSIIKLIEDRATCAACWDALKKWEPLYLDDHVGADDALSAVAMMQHCKEGLTAEQFAAVQQDAQKARKTASMRTAWRIEGTLREYPQFDPVNVWFDYPVHRADDTGVLSDLEPETEKASWKKAKEQQKTADEREKESNQSLEMAFQALDDGQPVTVKSLAEYLGVSERTVWRKIKKHGGFTTETDRNDKTKPAVVTRKPS